MEIKIPFLPYDKVWTMDDNKPKEFFIKKIIVNATFEDTGRILLMNVELDQFDNRNVKALNYYSHKITRPLFACFATKKELLNSFL